MSRLGCGHDSLARVNPRTITLSSTAYGHTGPWRRAGSRARTVDAACACPGLPAMKAAGSASDIAHIGRVDRSNENRYYSHQTRGTS